MSDEATKILTFVKEENTIISLQKLLKGNFFYNRFKFIYARPYINGISTHSKQQVAVHGHSGQNAKCCLKRKEKVKAKRIKICLNDYFQILTTG
jgi:hypothetical protein